MDDAITACTAAALVGPLAPGTVELVHAPGWGARFETTWHVVPVTRTTRTMIVVKYRGVELRFRKSDGGEVGARVGIIGAFWLARF